MDVGDLSEKTIAGHIQKKIVSYGAEMERVAPGAGLIFIPAGVEFSEWSKDAGGSALRELHVSIGDLLVRFMCPLG